MAAPWSGRPHNYAGWVPNVHSHLSFSLIGAARGDDVKGATFAYPDPELKRLVVVLETRQTDDFLAPLWWTRWRRKGARQDFVMVGSTEEVSTPIDVVDAAPGRSGLPLGIDGLRTAFDGILVKAGLKTAAAPSSEAPSPTKVVRTAPDAQGMLRGSIYVFPRQKVPANAEVQAAALAEIRRSTAALASEKPSETAFDAFPVSVAAAVKPVNLVVELQFALFRTGEARLWFEEEQPFGLPTTALDVLARQAYFFLKDMVHHHVHHDAKSDQITPLVPLGPRPKKDREEHWRRATAWSLTRSVDALARRGKLQDLREATGILAYADAFQTTLLQYSRREDDAWSFDPNAATYGYDYKHIRESLKVQLDQASARRNNLGQMIVAGLAGCIAATSLLASTISAHNGVLPSNMKIKGLRAVVPGLAEEWLLLAARYYLLPAFLCASFLAIVSSQVLAEDRIGARRVKRRKLEQAVRGITNSVAARRGWSAKAIQRSLRITYILLILATVFALFWGPPLLIRATDAIASVDWPGIPRRMATGIMAQLTC